MAISEFYLEKLLNESRADGLTMAFGLKVQTYERAFTSAAAVTSGTIYALPVYLRAGELISTLKCAIAVAGVSITLAKLGLYASTFELLASTANLTTAWQSVGVKEHLVESPYLVPMSAAYYLSLLYVGTSLQVEGAVGGDADVAGPMNGIYALAQQTGQADLTDPIALSAGTVRVWMGAS